MKISTLKRMLSLLMASCLLITGCAVSDNEASADEAALSEEVQSGEVTEDSAETSATEASVTELPAMPSYEEVKLPVYRGSMDTTETITVRYFEDEKDIAYVSLSDYYDMLVKDGVTKNASLSLTEDNGVFCAMTKDGSTAYFDPVNSTVTSKDFLSFANTTILVGEDYPDVSYDGAPFVQYDHVETTGAKETVFDLSEYGIRMLADENDIYLPFTVTSILFSGVMLRYYVLSSGAVYEFGGFDTSLDYSYFAGNENFVTDIFEDGERTEADAALSYSCLCFTVDNFSGFPGRSIIEASPYNLKDNGLDASLDATEYGQKTKEYLKSTSWAEYLAGLYMVNALFYDGGHSWLSYNGYIYSYDEDGNTNIFMSEDMYQEFRELVSGVSDEEPIATYSDEYTEMFMTYYLCKDTKKKVFDLTDEEYENGFYREEGDTAIISFDSFMFDLQAWKDYYASGCSGDVPSDSMGVLRNGFLKAGENPEIENIVIDLTSNGGGSSDFLVTLMEMLTGEGYLNVHLGVTDETQKTYYKTDTDFNGVFDENDGKYDYNFAILVSDFSFSCASMFPTLAHDEGVLIIGEEPGGGTCMVLDNADTNGLTYRLSSFMKCVNKDGRDVEEAKKSLVDITIETPETEIVNDEGLPSIEKDYTGFYDLKYLSSLF